MEMRIIMGGYGLSVPSSRIGVNVITGAAIDFRSEYRAEPFRLIMGDAVSMSGASGTIAASQIQTEWFGVNVSRHPWLHRKNRLTGKRAELTCRGTFVASGEVDVQLTVFDEKGHPSTLMQRALLDAKGFQIDATKLRGTLQRWFNDAEKNRNEHLRTQ